MECSICGSEAEWVENKKVYGRNYGKSVMIWLCTNSKCGAYVGCHQNTQRPKGTFADKATRQARMKAHAALDPLWQPTTKRLYKRQTVYKMLSAHFGHDIHIGESDIATCEQIINAVPTLFKENPPPNI